MECQSALKQMIVVLLISLAAGVGCGPATDADRLPVFGAISGELLAAGSISFIPSGGNKGPGAVASIEHGKYRFDSATGPIAGKHTVIIMPRIDKKMSGGTASPPASSEPWQLSVEVPSKPPYQLDLQLDASTRVVPMR